MNGQVIQSHFLAWWYKHRPNPNLQIFKRLSSTNFTWSILKHLDSYGLKSNCHAFKFSSYPAGICSKLTYLHLCSSVSIVNFEQVNAGWVDLNITIIKYSNDEKQTVSTFTI